MKTTLIILFSFGVISTCNAQSVTIVGGGNGSGSATNQLNQPEGLCLDNSGNVYVADPGNYRVIKFAPGSTSSTNGVVVAGGNGNGSALNQIGNAQKVFVDLNGTIYVADASNHRIMKFPSNSTSDSNAVIVAGGNGYGSAPNQLYQPDGLFVDNSGNLYVSDFINARIQKFPAGSTSSTNGITVAGGNNAGSGANQLNEPGGIFVDRQGNIFVADFNNYRIQKFPAGSTSATNAITVAGANGYGSATNQLSAPIDVYLDSMGNIYVTDEDNARIQKFPSNSTSGTSAIIVAGGNGQGMNINQLYYPSGGCVDQNGYIYTCDFYNNRVQKWGHNYIAGINSDMPQSGGAIYPNPNTGSFKLESSSCIGKEYTITDILGRIAQHQVITSDKMEIELKNVSSGNYILGIKGNTNTVIRFMVNP